MPELSQQQFDLPGYKEQEGITTAQFMRKATWHGTSRSDWANRVKEAEVLVHHGTPQAAMEREGVNLGSKYYPVVAKETSLRPPVGDIEANLVTEKYDRIHSARTKGDANFARRHVNRAHEKTLGDLEQGKTISYKNAAEDRGSISHVSPPGGFQTLSETTDFNDLPIRRQEFMSGSDMTIQGIQQRGHVRRPLLTKDPYSPGWVDYEGRPL